MLCLWDEDLDGAGATAAMIENLDEFYSVVKDAISQWSDGKVSNIAKNDQEISEEKLAVMKSAQVRLNERQFAESFRGKRRRTRRR